MESIIIDSLEDLGYPGPVCEGDNFEKALDDGPASVAFTQLIEWLTKELKHLCDLEESVNAINVSQDSSNFMLELSGFLREFGCPYSSLTEGPISERLSTRESRLQLLDYLTTELASTRMIAVDKPAALISKAAEPERQTNESELGNYMKIMVIALGFSKPPANITATKLFSKVESKIKELLTKHPYQIGKPLLKTRLSEKHWNHIMNINNALTTEYCTRREMLLKRLDVTIQSFMWSDKAKKRENDIAKVYQPIRKQLTSKTEIGVTEILAAREDLLRIWKTSSGKSREETKCAINRVLIGRVPDRGGRAWEHEPPPPEMPAFQKRQPGGRGGGQGGFRDGGHTGGSQRGRVKGGWGDNQQQQQGGQWGQNRSGYGGQNPHGYQQNFNQQADYHGQSNYGGGNRHGQDRGGGGYNSYDGRGSYNNGRGGYNDGRGSYNDGRGGYNDGRGGYNDGGGSRRGGRGGRGGWGRGGSGSRY